MIHDGDGCVLFSSVRGGYCAGTVTNSVGNTVATFAIDYVSDETTIGELVRHVLAIHIGPLGHWCRRLAELETYNDWLPQFLARQYHGSDGAISVVDEHEVADQAEYRLRIRARATNPQWHQSDP